MANEAVTATLLGSVLSTDEVRKLFKFIARSRIAEKATIKEDIPNAENNLVALLDADLIGSAPGEKYYVTAKGLKVERDLEKILL